MAKAHNTYLNVEKAEALAKLILSDHKDLRKKFSEAKININVAFVSVDEESLIKSLEIGNQIIVIYKNGVFDALPLRINGIKKIKEWLGIRIHKIKYWGVLPTSNNPIHPVTKASIKHGNGTVVNLNKDIHGSSIDYI